MKIEEIITLCRRAYKEGREHQFNDCHPDIGFSFPKKFEDTTVYKELSTKKQYDYGFGKDTIKR